MEIKSTPDLDFEVSSRGWCYLLEPHGLLKGDFDAAQALINDCRKSGDLPLDICSEDERRAAEHLERIDDSDPLAEAASIVEYVDTAQDHYNPISFWESQDTYIEMMVEKIDLKSLFSSVCEPFHIALTNGAGWSDLNSRAAMMRRFAKWERRRKRCVLLYCGDHDPGGLQISDFIKSNMDDLSGAVGWSPRNLEIDRFGLNYKFIEKNKLTWIENLATSSKKIKVPLNSKGHPDHYKQYVQSYLREFGVKKCEANALVRRPRAGRSLCRQAILQYLPADAPDQFETSLELKRTELREEIDRLLGASS